MLPDQGEKGRLQFDFLIVGSGFAGSVIAERIATQLGRKVLVIDRRNHIGGNAFDFRDSHGILVHKYGPHIFHTNSRMVWDYISQFTEWIPYEHRVLAEVDDKLVPVPFNLTSLRILFGEQKATSLEEKLFEHYSFGDNIPIMVLRQSEVPEIRSLADYIYRVIFLGYTLKQWGHVPDELGASVTQRVPVRLSHDDRYFQDKYQAIPKLGYAAMFERMLRHTNISVSLNTEYSDVSNRLKSLPTIYTGPIDAFFNYRHGDLPYRSLDFDLVHHSEDRVQPVAQVNFPNGHRYTRITEFKHITSQDIRGTTVAIEYPREHVRGLNEPYYPVPTRVAEDLLGKYREEMKSMEDGTVFVGRLAEYRYFNMDQMIERALSVFEGEISPRYR